MFSIKDYTKYYACKFASFFRRFLSVFGIKLPLASFEKFTKEEREEFEKFLDILSKNFEYTMYPKTYINRGEDNDQSDRD